MTWLAEEESKRLISEKNGIGLVLHTVPLINAQLFLYNSLKVLSCDP